MTSSALSLASVLLTCTAALAEPNRPRIFITAADITGLRHRSHQRVPTSLGHVPAAAWDTLKAQADRFVKAPPYHYSVNMPGRNGGPPKKWEYILSEAPPPPHNAHRHYPPWTAMFQERSDSITTRLRYLLTAHLITQDGRYFGRAKDIVLKLCAWPGIWTDPSYGGGRPCLDTGHAAQWVAVFYDWCYEQLTPVERAIVRTALVDKALAPIDAMIDKVSPYHNYTAVVATGLCIGGIALLGEDDRAAGWIDHAIARARLNFDAQGRDGGAMEGPGYGTYATNGFADMLWALSTARVQSDLFEHPYIATLPRYCVSLLSMSSRQQPCFGDGGPTAGYANIMLVLALRGDTDAAWYCRQIRTLEPTTIRRFLALDPERVRPVQPTFNPSACFIDIGYAILRDAYSKTSPFLAFKAGPPEKTVGHNHLDHNSFVINYGKTWPAWDPGYRSYFSPPERKYTTSTFGHNSIVLDLDDQYLSNMKTSVSGHDQVHVNRGRIREFFTSDAFDYVLGDAAAAYNTDKRHVLDRFDRQIVFAKPHLFFIRDTLAAPEPHTYSFMLHGPPASEFDYGEGQVTTQCMTGYLQSFIFSPAGFSFRTGLYPGAERRGPYLAATTGKARQTTVTAVLVPRHQPLRLTNGGFERGLASWRPRAMPGWLKNHVVDREVLHSGTASARIDEPGGYYYSTQFALSPGTKITARWWAKCTKRKGASSFLYYWRNGKSFASTPGPAAKRDKWRSYELSDVAPKGTEEVCLAIQFFGKGQCWYDDVEITVDSQTKQSEPAAATALDAGSDGAIATVDGTTYILVCGEAGELRTVKTASHTIHTDAELAAVALGGPAPRAFLLRGSRLSLNGRAINPVKGEWRTTGK